MLMIYLQHRHNHFMFWILNTIEYRLNELDKSIKNMEKNFDNKSKKHT